MLIPDSIYLLLSLDFAREAPDDILFRVFFRLPERKDSPPDIVAYFQYRPSQDRNVRSRGSQRSLFSR